MNTNTPNTHTKNKKKLFYKIQFLNYFAEFYVDCHLSEAGFSEEWTSTNEERSRQRQVEVQANIVTNPNRPTEYRTVTTPPTAAQTQYHDQEAEERTFVYLCCKLQPLTF